MNTESRRQLAEIIKREHGNIGEITILKKGELAYQEFFNGCNETSKLHVYSVSKSVLSLLFGIALDRGLIESLEQKVLDFFPDYQIPEKEQILQQITLKDMLTMTTPYKYDAADPSMYVPYFTSTDWVEFSLYLLGGEETIGEFKYTPLIGPDILSGILTKVTGKSVLAFAQENLFGPLGINVEKNLTFNSAEEQLAFNQSIDFNGWVCDEQGINAGGWGLTLSSGDMAKIGQLYLTDGRWNQEQVVSSEWLKASTTPHSFWEEMKLSYGYLWWVLDSEKGIFAAMGDGGNMIYVNQEKQLVIAIAALFDPQAKDRLELISRYIEPLF